LNIVELATCVWYVVLNIEWYVVECVLDAEKGWCPYIPRSAHNQTH
jgi:hypothetical protein